MSKALALMAVVAGFGMVAYVMPSPDRGAERRLADVVRITTNGTQVAMPDDPVTRLTAPNAIAPAGRVTIAPSQPMAGPAIPAATPVMRRVTVARAGDPDQRTDLVRDLQRELKRVGCYGGAIDGMWSPAAQSAMGAFTARVNATLPVAEPDHILLALVQGRASLTCTASCPTGQAPAVDGRCIPAALVALAARQPAAPVAGRMSLAGPVKVVRAQSRAKRDTGSAGNRRPAANQPTRTASRSTQPSAPRSGNGGAQFATQLFARLSHNSM